MSFEGIGPNEKTVLAMQVKSSIVPVGEQARGAVYRTGMFDVRVFQCCLTHCQQPETTCHIRWVGNSLVALARDEMHRRAVFPLNSL